MKRLVPGVWFSSDPVRILGTKLEATMAVVRLPNDELLLYSPVSMTERRRRAVEALGTVSHLYAPNTFHHVSIGTWTDAFPDALVHAPSGAAAQTVRSSPSLRLVVTR